MSGGLRRPGWVWGWFIGLAFGTLIPVRASTTNQNHTPVVILALGAAGEPGYATNFAHQLALWTNAASRGGARVITVGSESSARPDDRTRLQQTLEAEPKDDDSALWLVLIGHGTFDGKEARFNLRGPDVTAKELATWLQPFHRPLAIIDTASASGPFVQALAATNRVVITATRSGFEQNATRFGEFFAQALLDPAADLDADGQTSLLEAFLSASQTVAESYRASGQLLTEHALIDDNGDGLGTPAEWFRGLHAVKKPKDKATLDSVRAHQFHLIPSAAEMELSPAARAGRNELERKISALREQKASLPEAAYYEQLEAILLELAKVYSSKPAAAQSQ